MMQNLPVPTLTHNSMFYLRQLWEYNFGVHDCTTDSGTMYMWSELVAKRGADEICSCQMQYISNLPLQVKKLTCYSDSCFGQNKNFEMICFWNWQIVQGRFSQIDHKFLVRDHTYFQMTVTLVTLRRKRTQLWYTYLLTGKSWFGRFVVRNPI